MSIADLLEPSEKCILATSPKTFLSSMAVSVRTAWVGIGSLYRLNSNWRLCAESILPGDSAKAGSPRSFRSSSRSGAEPEEMPAGARRKRLLSPRSCAPVASRTAACVRMAASSDLERSEEHTSELQSRENLVCRLLLEK